MPGVFVCRGVKTKTIKALACQADEEGTTPVENETFPFVSKQQSKSEKRLLGRSFKVLRCLSPLGVLREARHVKIPGEDSDVPKRGGKRSEAREPPCTSSKKQTIYCRVFNEKDPWKSSADGSELRLFLRGGNLNRRHNLAGELFNSAGGLRVVEEGREWEEDDIEEESVEYKNSSSVSSPTTTQNTTSCSESSYREESPDSPESPERIFKIVDDSCLGNEYFNQSGSGYVQEGGERIGIQPISLQQLSTQEIPIGFGLALSSSYKKQVGGNSTKFNANSTAPPPPPDPPASKISDSNFSYSSFDESKASMECCDIACRTDRTVVSELTCDDSLSETASPRTDQDHAAALKLVRESLRNRANILDEAHLPKLVDRGGDETACVQSKGSKMDELISKFESLATSKASIEQNSLVAKLQQQELQCHDTATSSSIVVDISNSLDAEEVPKVTSRDPGFFWRSRPQTQDTSDTSPDDSDLDQSTVSKEYPETPDDEMLQETKPVALIHT